MEELPRIINTMSLLWSVIKREDSHKRPTDFFGTTKGSSSVYFKATKVGVLLNCCISHHPCRPFPHSAFYVKLIGIVLVLGHKEFLKNSHELQACTVPTYNSRLFAVLFAHLHTYLICLMFCFVLWASVNSCSRANCLWIVCTFHRQ